MTNLFFSSSVSLADLCFRLLGGASPGTLLGMTQSRLIVLANQQTKEKDASLIVLTPRRLRCDFDTGVLENGFDVV